MQNMQNNISNAPQQFFHVQRIVPSNQDNMGQQSNQSHSTGTGQHEHSSNSNSGVKINIVNVHNEFNIQNNIII